MARFGTGIQAGLGRIDYTPYMQGAVAGSQSIAQGIAGLGRAIGTGVEKYFDEKEKDKQLGSAINDLIGETKTNKLVGNYVGSFVSDPAKLNDPEALKSAILGLSGGDKAKAAMMLRDGLRQIKAQEVTSNRITSLVDAGNNGKDVFATGRELGANINEINTAFSIVNDQRRSALEADRIKAETERLKAEAARLRSGEPAKAPTKDERIYNAARAAFENQTGRTAGPQDEPAIMSFYRAYENQQPGEILSFAQPNVSGQPGAQPAAAVPTSTLIAGSKQEAEAKEAQRKQAEEAKKAADLEQSRRRDAFRYLDTLNEARSLVTGGAGGPLEGVLLAPEALAIVGQPRTANLKRRYKELTAQATLDKLLRMRQLSPTGGSIQGNVSNYDAQNVEASAGLLDVAAPESEQLAQLNKIEAFYSDLIGKDLYAEYQALQRARNLEQNAARGAGSVNSFTGRRYDLQTEGKNLTDSYLRGGTR